MALQSLKYLRCQELLKYMQYQGNNLVRVNQHHGGDQGSASKNPENRFANNLLDKLIMYLDSSTPNMKLIKPSANFSRGAIQQKSLL